MKKILFYINSICYGGAERVIVNLANMFSENGYKVILVTSFFEQEEYQLSGNVKRLSLETQKSFKSFIKRNLYRTKMIRKICKRERPEIVVSFMAEANFRAIISTRGLNIKTAISIRNDPVKEYPNWLFKLTAKLLYPMADGVIFQTTDAQKWFSKRIQSKSKIILNQVDQKFYDTNFVGERKNIVSVGRLEKQKNYELLIKAFNLIESKVPNEELLIYGNGTEKNQLSKLINDLGLNKRVKLMGTSLDIQEKIKNAKLFVLSSNYEGLPNVVMESMALGIPVISTDCPCGGPNMIINNGENGILVSVNNVKELANAMLSTLTKNELLDYLSKNEKEYAEKFKPNVIYKQWEEYLAKIAN